MTAQDHNRDWALRLAGAGLAVFPAGADKKARVKWRDASTTDAQTIAAWWAQWPESLPAIDLAKTNLLVLDGDRHGGPDGRAALRELLLAQGGDYNGRATPGAITPRDGAHIYFKQNGRAFGNSRGDLPDGIDVRGVGGYVIAPYAALPDGRCYHTVDGMADLITAFRSGTIPPIPSGIAKLLEKPARKEPPPEQQTASTSRSTSSREEAYGAAALTSIAAELAAAASGERNNALNGAAYRLGRMVSRGWISRPDVADALWAACESNGLVVDDGAGAAQSTLGSGLKAGEQDPHPDLEDRPRDDFGETRQSYQEQRHEGERPEPKASSIRWHGDVDLQESRPYLMQGLIPEIGIGLVSGQWGTFKTFTALDIAHCAMTGEPFIGCETMRRGGVLFIALEGTDEVAIRLQGVIDHKGKLLERAPFAWVESCPRLVDKSAVDELGTLAREVANRLKADFDLPLSLIVIDTMVAAAGYARDGQENDAAANQAVMNTLRHVARKAGCFVLAVDHFGKAVETGTRGSSSKEAAADVVLALLGDKSISGEVTNTRLALRKRRGGANGQEFPFRPRVVDMGVDKFGNPASTLVIDWGTAADAPTAAKTDPRWSKSLRLLRQCLMNTLANQSVEMQVYPDSPMMVQTVNIETVRAEFYRCYLADGDTDTKKAAARRQAFNRAVNHAQAQGVIGLRDLGTSTVVWLATKEKAADEQA
jgi:hypothetical protein